MAGSTDRYVNGDQQALGRKSHDEKEKETAAIQAGIRETRERMSDTVEQIGDRIDPSKLKEQAMHELHDATIGRVEDMAHQAVEQLSVARRSIAHTMSENPIPFTMVGIGMGWLIWNGMSNKSSASAHHADELDGNAVYGKAYDGGSMSYNDRDTGTRAKVGEIVDSVKETATNLTERTQEMAGTVSAKATEQARVQTRRVQREYQSNPLAIGAAALALGIVAGLALPATDKEAELVGAARDQVVDKATQVANDAKSKIGEVAGKVFEQAQATAKDAAHEAGLIA